MEYIIIIFLLIVLVIAQNLYYAKIIDRLCVKLMARDFQEFSAFEINKMREEKRQMMPQKPGYKV